VKKQIIGFNMIEKVLFVRYSVKSLWLQYIMVTPVRNNFFSFIKKLCRVPQTNIYKM